MCDEKFEKYDKPIYNLNNDVMHKANSDLLIEPELQHIVNDLIKDVTTLGICSTEILDEDANEFDRFLSDLTAVSNQIDLQNNSIKNNIDREFLCRPGGKSICSDKSLIKCFGKKNVDQTLSFDIFQNDDSFAFNMNLGNQMDPLVSSARNVNTAKSFNEQFNQIPFDQDIDIEVGAVGNVDLNALLELTEPWGTESEAISVRNIELGTPGDEVVMEFPPEDIKNPTVPSIVSSSAGKVAMIVSQETERYRSERSEMETENKIKESWKSGLEIEKTSIKNLVIEKEKTTLLTTEAEPIGFQASNMNQFLADDQRTVMMSLEGVNGSIVPVIAIPSDKKDIAVPSDIKTNEMFHCRITENRNDKQSKMEYECHLCTKKFIRQKLLIDHLAVDHCGQAACVYCDKTFERSASFLHHIKNSHTDRRPYECQLCGQRFLAKNSMSSHKRLHETREIFQCNQCDKQFFESNILTAHVRKDHEKLLFPYLCIICKKSFKANRSLQQHFYKTHQKNRCTVCGEQLPSKRHVKVHMNIHLNKERNCEDSLTSQQSSFSLEKPFNKQKFCSKTLLPLQQTITSSKKIDSSASIIMSSPTKDEWSKILSTLDVKEFFETATTKGLNIMPTIDLANEETVNKTLKRKRTATDNETAEIRSSEYGCHLCNQTFNSQKWLIDHLVLNHCKQAVCVKCDKTFDSPSDIINHFKPVHPDRRLLPNKYSIISQQGSHGLFEKYRCLHCDKRFYQSNELVIHVFNEHFKSFKSHSCRLCGKSYDTFEGMTIHFKSDHPKRCAMPLSCHICGILFSNIRDILWHMCTVKCDIVHKKTEQQLKAKRRQPEDEQLIATYTGPPKTTSTEQLTISVPEEPKTIPIELSSKQLSMLKRPKKMLTKHSEVLVKSAITSISTVQPKRVNLKRTIIKSTKQSKKKAIACNEIPGKPKTTVTMQSEMTPTAQLETASKKATVSSKSTKRKKNQPSVNDESKLLCWVCGVRFLDKVQFHKHLTTHDVKLRCGVCGLEFSSQNELQCHVLVAHRNTPKPKPQSWSCPVCDVDLELPESLSKHMVMEHPIVRKPRLLKKN